MSHVAQREYTQHTCGCWKRAPLMWYTGSEVVNRQDFWVSQSPEWDGPACHVIPTSPPHGDTFSHSVFMGTKSEARVQVLPPVFRKIWYSGISLPARADYEDLQMPQKRYSDRFTGLNTGTSDSSLNWKVSGLKYKTDFLHHCLESWEIVFDSGVMYD